MGDSAGGGLAFATCIEANALGLPRPACLVALSPWTDLTITGKSMHDNAGTDQLFSPAIAPFNRASCFGCYDACMQPANEMQSTILHQQFKKCAAGGRAAAALARASTEGRAHGADDRPARSAVLERHVRRGAPPALPAAAALPAVEAERGPGGGED